MAQYVGSFNCSDTYLVSYEFDNHQNDLLPHRQGAEIDSDETGSGCATNTDVKCVDEPDRKLAIAGKENGSSDKRYDNAALNVRDVLRDETVALRTMQGNEAGRS